MACRAGRRRDGHCVILLSILSFLFSSPSSLFPFLRHKLASKIKLNQEMKRKKKKKKKKKKKENKYAVES